MTSAKTLIRLFIIALFAAAAPAWADAEPFPQPPELDRDVDFWVNVFTEYSSREGVLHDNRNLAVVYERVDLPASVSRRERNRLAQIRRKHYQAILQILASGKRDNLSDEERRVLDIWPADVSNSELRAARDRIRFQLGLADRFRDGLIRSGRWRAHVHAEFGKRGVPIALAALPHVESSYNPDARSHVGASGIWQFTRSTGRRFLQVDHVLDERNDPFLATEAAAKLLAYNYSITGNWPMAITAYNHGLAGARRAMRQFGDTAYTKILREYRGRTFGFASRNFYVAFLAALQIDQNTDQYFPGLVLDKPIDYQTHTLTTFLPAATFADALGISERELRRYNPALQSTIFQGSKYLPKAFEIRIPDAKLTATIDRLVAAIAENKRFKKQLPDLFHTIARGDTLSGIADEYGTRVSTLMMLNKLGSSHRIRAGQKLRLPAAGPAPVVVAASSPDEPEAKLAVVITEEAEVPDITESIPDIASIEEPTEIAVITEDSVTKPMDATESSLLTDPSDYTVSADRTIEVHPLETLGHYADWLGIKTQRLRDINGLAFRTPVEVGQRIKLDLGSTDAASFENIRSHYHQRQQDLFFRTHTITGVREHIIDRGESVWILSLRQYGVPIWLFRQYNPELDPHTVRPGTRISFPVLAKNSDS